MGAILVAGHLCLDLTPALGPGAAMIPGQLIEVGELTLSLGGCVANTGRALAALGVPIQLSAAVAADELGDVVRRRMAEEGLPIDGLSVVPDATTSYSLVLQVPGSDRTFWHNPGVNTVFDGTAVEFDDIDVIHVGYPPLLPALVSDNGRALIRLFERARTLRITTSLDMSVVDRHSAMGAVDWDAFLSAVLPLTDIFTPSFDDLASALLIDEPMTSELAARLAHRCVDLGAAVVTISGGAEGLSLATGSSTRLADGGRGLSGLGAEWTERQLVCAARPVATVATTNGAGDAATAGFLYALSAGMTPEGALEFAVDSAAATISGGRPARPTSTNQAER
jgi:sugar/nucleoside kinase (ribokinase family)